MLGTQYEYKFKMTSSQLLGFLLVVNVGLLYAETFKRSSWDSYLDNLVAQSKDASGAEHCDKAVIIGLDDGAKWTSDNQAHSFKITSGEAANIARVFKSRDFVPFMTNGITCESIRYQFLREEDGKVVFGKKKENGAVTLQKSKTAIVIGHTPEGSQQGNTNKAVSVIAEYLESMNM